MAILGLQTTEMSIKIHILHCGQVGIDEATTRVEKTLHPAPYSGILRSKKHQIIVPVSAYLIEHPKGLILIDTGWHTDVRIKPKQYLGWIHYTASTPYLPQGQAIHEQLEQLGYKASDIDYLFVSHLHTDHVSGLALVKEAKRILTSDIELKDAKKYPMNYKPFMWANTKLETFTFEKSPFGPENLAYDLFGDNSIVFVNLPGHTNGMTGTIIQNNNKFVLLCSDAGYMQKSWKELLIPGITVNKKKALASLKWIKEMSEKPNCIEVVANHDPELKPRTIEL